MADRERESAFLLAAVRAPFSRGLERPEFYQDADAWLVMFDHATRLHCSSVLMAAIDRAPWRDSLPVAARLLVEECLHRERMVLAILDDELERSLKLLIRARIPVVVLKGMDFSRRFYAERLTRPMTDVDLLVPREAWSDALRALGRGGYRLSGRHEPGRHRVELARTDGGPVVELHRGLLVSDDARSLDALWERTEEGLIPGLPRQARSLALEDCVEYLICHSAVQHLLESPIWLNDLHQIVMGGRPVEWERVIAGLRRRRGLTAGWFMLQFLSTRWETAVPATVLSALDGEVGVFRRRQLRALMDPETWFVSRPRGIAWVARSRFLLRDSALDALRYGMARKPAPGPELL
jgi:hypothetical protein